MSNTAAGQWVSFFNASGIPSPAAATYAHIFVENRIRTDMLMELNKEYLQEMGITLTGDIISILRHAKNVNDQTTREKILHPDVVTSTISPGPVQRKHPSSTVTKMATVSSKKPMPPLTQPKQKSANKKPSTATSKVSVTEKPKSPMYADREKSIKPGVFKRLAIDINSINLNDKTTSPKKNNNIINLRSNKMQIDKVNPSIFSRLGNKTAESTGLHVKPILKNSVKNRLSTIMKTKQSPATVVHPQKQIILAVKRVPVKRTSNNIDSKRAINVPNDKSHLNGVSEKFVKFSSTAEVRQIVPTKSNNDVKNIKTRLTMNSLNTNKKNSNFVKSPTNNAKLRTQLDHSLHITKKNTKPVPPKNRIISNKLNSKRLKSDIILNKQNIPIHTRLGISKTSNRRVVLTSQQITSSNLKSLNDKSSVFDRLGFN